MYVLTCKKMTQFCIFSNLIALKMKVSSTWKVKGLFCILLSCVLIIKTGHGTKVILNSEGVTKLFPQGFDELNIILCVLCIHMVKKCCTRDSIRVHSIFNPPGPFFFIVFIKNFNFEYFPKIICLFEHMNIVTIQL